MLFEVETSLSFIVQINLKCQTFEFNHQASLLVTDGNRAPNNITEQSAIN
jgi:hypothetical protein